MRLVDRGVEPERGEVTSQGENSMKPFHCLMAINGHFQAPSLTNAPGPRAGLV